MQHLNNSLRRDGIGLPVLSRHAKALTDFGGHGMRGEAPECVSSFTARGGALRTRVGSRHPAINA
jgi:hypothetical protein